MAALDALGYTQDQPAACPGRSLDQLVVVEAHGRGVRSPEAPGLGARQMDGHSPDLPVACLAQNLDPLVEKARLAAKFPVEGRWGEQPLLEVSGDHGQDDLEQIRHSLDLLDVQETATPGQDAQAAWRQSLIRMSRRNAGGRRGIIPDFDFYEGHFVFSCVFRLEEKVY